MYADALVGFCEEIASMLSRGKAALVRMGYGAGRWPLTT
jgi:hypothetical protein